MNPTKLQIILTIFFLTTSILPADSCLSAHGMRSVIRHFNKIGNHSGSGPLNVPVPIQVSENEATLALMAETEKSKRWRHLAQMEGNTTTSVNVTSNDNSTAYPFDDPNFIPGQFLDLDGSPKVFRS